MPCEHDPSTPAPRPSRRIVELAFGATLLLQVALIFLVALLALATIRLPSCQPKEVARAQR